MRKYILIFVAFSLVAIASCGTGSTTSDTTETTDSTVVTTDTVISESVDTTKTEAKNCADSCSK